MEHFGALAVKAVQQALQKSRWFNQKWFTTGSLKKNVFIKEKKVVLFTLPA